MNGNDAKLALLAGQIGGATLADETVNGIRQNEILQDDVLPSRGLDRGKWESMGGVYGEVSTKDKRYINVKLPAGWEKTRGHDSRFLILRDQHGRQRASCFDEWCGIAEMSWSYRFNYRTQPVDVGFSKEYDPNKSYIYELVITDCEEVVKAIASSCGLVENRYFIDTYREPLEEAGKAYMDEYYPDHKNYTLYWDLP